MQRTISEFSANQSGRFPSESFVSFTSAFSKDTAPTIKNENWRIRDEEMRAHDGFDSWVACVVAFFDTLLLFGFLCIYPLFLVTFQEDMGTSLSNAATLGSLAYGLVSLFGPLASYLAMRFGNRKIMMIGSLVCAVSTYGSSYVQAFNLLFATFAVPFALGTAMVNVPAFVVPIEYFKKYRTITTGIIASGSSMGTLLLAPLIQAILEKVGWRTAFRGLSISFFVLVLANAQVRPLDKLLPKTSNYEQTSSNRSTLCEDFKLWSNRVFVLWVSVIAIVYFGYNIPVMFLASYSVFIGGTPRDASFLLMVMGAATTVSRLATGGLMNCDLLKRLHAKQIIFVLMGTVHLLLAHINTVAGLYAFSVVRGLLDGAHIVMLPTLTASIVGAKRAILGWGHLAGAISLTYTLGPLAAGAVMEKTGSYTVPFIMAGLPLIVAGLLLFLLPWAQRSYRKKRYLNKISSPKIPLIPDPFDLDDMDPLESIEEYITHQAHLAETAEQLARSMSASTRLSAFYPRTEGTPRPIITYSALVTNRKTDQRLSETVSDPNLLSKPVKDKLPVPTPRKIRSDTVLVHFRAHSLKSRF